MAEVRIQSVCGEDILPYLEWLAELRIKVFREWPYLYEGSVEYERGYLQRYVDCPDSIVVLAFDDDQLVGASTGLPLISADQDFQRAFDGSDYPLDSIFYFAESVLLTGWRGRGIGRRFFVEREEHARHCGSAWAAFCAVDRPANDARRPSDYRDLEPFWSRLGYVRKEKIKAFFNWPEVGSGEESQHAMTFWLKQL